MTNEEANRLIEENLNPKKCEGLLISSDIIPISEGIPYNEIVISDQTREAMYKKIEDGYNFIRDFNKIIKRRKLKQILTIAFIVYSALITVALGILLFIR